MIPDNPALFDDKLLEIKVWLEFRDSRDNPFIIKYRDGFQSIQTETFWSFTDCRDRYIELYQLGRIPKMFINTAYLTLIPGAGVEKPEVSMLLYYQHTPTSNFVLECQRKKLLFNFILQNFVSWREATLIANVCLKEGDFPFLFADAASFTLETGEPVVPPIESK